MKRPGAATPAKRKTWKARVCSKHGKRVSCRLTLDMTWCPDPACWIETHQRAGLLPRSIHEPVLAALQKAYERVAPIATGGKRVTPRELVAMTPEERAGWDYDDRDLAIEIAQALTAVRA